MVTNTPLHTVEALRTAPTHTGKGGDDAERMNRLESRAMASGYGSVEEALDDLARIRAGAQPEGDKLFYSVWGTHYPITAVFVTVRDANAFMAEHPGHGVIAWGDPFILIADCKDCGVKP